MLMNGLVYEKKRRSPGGGLSDEIWPIASRAHSMHASVYMSFGLMEQVLAASQAMRLRRGSPQTSK